MKTSLVISAMGMAVLALLIAGCTSSPPGGAVPSASPAGQTPIVETTPAPTLSPVCEFTSCHGLDLECGPNPPSPVLQSTSWVISVASMHSAVRLMTPAGWSQPGSSKPARPA